MSADPRSSIGSPTTSTSSALKVLTAAEEAKITELVKKAVR